MLSSALGLHCQEIPGGFSHCLGPARAVWRDTGHRPGLLWEGPEPWQAAPVGVQRQPLTQACRAQRGGAGTVCRAFSPLPLDFGLFYNLDESRGASG